MNVLQVILLCSRIGINGPHYLHILAPSYSSVHCNLATAPITPLNLVLNTSHLLLTNPVDNSSSLFYSTFDTSGHFLILKQSSTLASLTPLICFPSYFFSHPCDFHQQLLFFGSILKCRCREGPTLGSHLLLHILFLKFLKKLSLQLLHNDET